MVRTEHASLELNQNPLMTPMRIKAMKNSDRLRDIFGIRVHTLTNGSRKLGQIIYHTPSPFSTQTESVYFKGPPGSGKSWGAYSLAGQTFFGEGRTWIIIDTKFSYFGNNRPNLKQRDNIKLFKGHPQGIPGNLMHIIAPQYYLEAASPREIDESLVTNYYKIPLRFICKNVLTLFELVKANRSAQYSAELDERFKQILIKTNNHPSLDDVYEMISEIIEDDNYSRVKSIYLSMFGKIQQLAKYTIDEKSQWSAIGEALFKTVEQSQIAGYKIPSWIVFTLGHSEHPEEPKNLAFISTVLTEIYAFAKQARLNNLPISLGIFMDELHTYVRDTQASSRASIHDLLFAWGRSSKVLRCFATQKDDQLDKIFRDDFGKLDASGTYSTVIGYDAIPEPGYAKYLNRLNSNPLQLDQPYYVPKIKTCPPLMCVEDDEPNDKKWIEKMKRERYINEKMTKNNVSFAPAVDPRLAFSYESLKAL